MTPGLTSIIIPAYQHARSLAAAIDSALAQTAPVEVIVVDDGSTDGTLQVLEPYARNGVTVIVIPHAGPSVARNRGIDAADGEFVMFLDADDTIEPTKIEEQLVEMTPEIGWVLCDVRIEREGRVANASQQYGYKDLSLSGWIEPELTIRNFIPIMSPLIRRSALADIRFDDNKRPEDWHFMHAVSRVARVRYVPKVLATYRKSKTGRGAQRPRHETVRISSTPPLRLNLACGQRGTPCWHPLAGMENLDKSLGWRFEDGLGDYVCGSVAGITESHGLMYVELERWPKVFDELVRVLEPGGVLRITEDNTAHPESRTYRTGWRGSQPGCTLTDPTLVREHMERAGLQAHEVSATSTHYRDGSLMQAFHGEAPHVFFIEGIREPCVLFSPHNDDETLFAAFSIIRYRPRVVVCYPSVRDYGDPQVRAAESKAAVDILGGGPLEQWDGERIVERMHALDDRRHPVRVFAPSLNASHPEHVAVAAAALEVFGSRVIEYQTYNGYGKVRDGEPVPFRAAWTARKREALACYRTQLAHPRAKQFFEWDLVEYQ